MCRVNGCPLLWIFPCLALGAEHPQPADQAGCGLNASRLENTLTVPFTGCYVENVSSEPVVFIHTNGLKCQMRFQTDSYSLQLLYEDQLGETQVATVTCHPGRESTPGPIPRSGIPPGTPASRCRTPPPPHTPPRAQRERSMTHDVVQTE